MKANPRLLAIVIALTSTSPPRTEAADLADPPAPSPESLQLNDGRHLAGRIGGEAAKGFQFHVMGQDGAIPLEAGAVVTFSGQGPAPTEGLPPFRVDLGLGRRVSGRLGKTDASEVRLVESSTGRAIQFARTGVRSIIQRVGEMWVFDDGFESLNGPRWTLIGDPQIVETPRLAGSRSARVPAGGTSLTTKLAEPIAAGRLEAAFFDNEEVVPGQQWCVDLSFRGPSGPETVRVILGWAEESLSVESPGGPALAVQRLLRTPGWHRLSVRFGPEQTEVAVDGNDLAHGRGPGGPLTEIRLASIGSGKTAPPAGLAGYFDDMRLVRFAEAVSGLEIDPTQDQVQLADGDQLFGSIRELDSDRVAVLVDNHAVELPWSEVAGVDFRRVATQGRPLQGLLVRVDWRSAPGNDPRDSDQAEGALNALDDTSLTLETSYSSAPLTIPRDRLRSLRVLGRGRRIVIDPTAHHMGNEVVGRPNPLDPPQPEGGVLEREFNLVEIPPGPAFLTFDVVQVVGEVVGLPYADLVRKGEVRTNLLVNGKAVDYLNRYVTSKNETPERLRIPVPAGVLQPGANRLRLVQVGRANDPDYLDDLGVLEIAVEFAPGGSANPPLVNP